MHVFGTIVISIFTIKVMVGGCCTRTQQQKESMVSIRTPQTNNLSSFQIGTSNSLKPEG